MHRVRFILSSLLLTTTAVAQETPTFVEKPGSMEFSGQMFALTRQLADGASLDERDEWQGRRAHALAELNRFEIRHHCQYTDLYVFRLGAGQTENAVAARLMATGLFEYVEPDWRVYPIACPNDPLFGSQWQHGSSHMDSCDAWDIETGHPATQIAICDTGIRTTHEDFQLHRLEGYNAVDQLWENQGGAVNDINGHGTLTSGCAAANGNNGVGVSGVGQNFSHRMMRVSNDSSGGANLSVIQHGALTAIAAGDRVASASYSGVDSNANRTTAATIFDMGGLLVWAAGNDGANLNWGHRDSDRIIVVGAHDSGNGKPSWSAYGRSVDVMAPGVSTLTTSSGGDSSYGSASGTSLSCPLAAGLCALLWSADPNLSPAQVELCLKLGCTDLGATGPDDTYAYGKVDSEASLIAIQNVKPAGGMLMSLKSNGTVGGVDADDDDVLHYDPDTGLWSMYFDASDVMDTTGNDLSGVCELDDGSLLLTFAEDVDLPGMTGGPNGAELTRHDIVRFIPTSTGDSTAGSFEFYFDGSDVGVSTDKENLRGVGFSGGDVFTTTQGAANFAGLVGRNEDIFRFAPSSLGAATAGSWSIPFDGNDSNVRLGKQGEQLDALHVSPLNGNQTFSTGGIFKVPVGKNGDSNDLLIYRSDNASGMEGRIFILLRGEDIGLGSLDIDGLHVRD